MSAPMEENFEEIPHQHIRQELCATRPVYREGRNPKAVKVYTINQESRYLLFQDVPALGTTQELIKLCAIHGAVEEYRMLDEFPSADKFTDVVLIKFSRIQSARHAKKKLDDWSFYGGVLHVSYAPEYESVEETREKLQERRKTIAARLRILGKDQSRKVQTFSSESTSQYSQSFESEDKLKKKLMTTKIESRIPSLNNSTNSKGITCNNQIVENQTVASTSYHSNSFSMLTTQNLHHDWQLQVPYNYGHHLNEERLPDKSNNPINSCYHGDNSSTQQTLVIPPPPMRDPFPDFSKLKKNSFDFARVPTANAPFPPNFDARTAPQDNSNDNEVKHNRLEENYEMVSSLHIPNSSRSLTCGKAVDLNHPKYKKVLENVGSKSEKVIVKEFKKTGSVPKFIPRQTLIRTKTESQKTNKNSDELGKEIRKNAVMLRDTQGPAYVPEEFKKPEVLPTEKAVEKTVTEIRKRLSTFSSEQEDSRKRPKSS